MVNKENADVIVTTDKLAELFGFSRQRINQLAKEGVLEKKAPGRFFLMLNIKKYIEFLRNGTVSEEEGEATALYWEEKALHERAKREKAEIELELFKGNLLKATDVEQTMADMILTAKSRLLSIPSKVSPKILGQKNITAVAEIIRGEIYEALNELKEMPAPRNDDYATDDT